MKPSEEKPLRDEIECLRRELSDLSDRHHAEFARISKSMTDLESKLGRVEVEESIAPTPPPLPKPMVIPAAKTEPTKTR